MSFRSIAEQIYDAYVHADHADKLLRCIGAGQRPMAEQCAWLEANLPEAIETLERAVEAAGTAKMRARWALAEARALADGGGSMPNDEAEL